MSGAVKKIALVTGANQGIGYHIVQQLASQQKEWTVLLGARDAKKGAEAVQKVALSNVQPILIDIDDDASIKKAADEVKSKFGGLDILINNAGMAFKGDEFNEDVVKRTFQTNYFGTMNAINTFLPILNKNARVINVSSASSVSALRKMKPELREKFLKETSLDGLTRQLRDFQAAVAAGDYKEKGYPETAYGMSKVGVSILTRVMAGEATNGVTFNSGCPGWCRTSMAGDKAPRSPEEGAQVFVTLATIADDKQTNGEFWEDNKKSSLTRDP